MLADVELQALNTVVTKHEPKLERAEPAAKRNLPITVINYGAGFSRLVAQIFRQNAQASDQNLAVEDIKTVAIEVGEHPFVGIEAVAGSILEAIMNVAQFR